MTIRFSLPLHDTQPRERVTVLIERDGAMNMPDFDWEQDDLMAFMTGQKSNARLLMRMWDGTPSERVGAIGNMLGLKPKVIRSLAADWVEHVFDAIEPLDEAQKDPVAHIRKSLSKTMKLVRRSIQHNYPVMGTDKYLIEAHEEAEEILSLLSDNSSMFDGIWDTIWNVAESLKWLSYNYGGGWRSASQLQDEWDKFLLRIATGTWNARACSRSNDTSSAEWENGHIEESEWQIRRFHDVMWAIQNRRPRPRIAETS